MRDIFRVRVKTKTGEIEIEGSQLFVEKKMEQLLELMKKMDHALAGSTTTSNKQTISEGKANKVKPTPIKNKTAYAKTTTTDPGKIIVPNSFRLWYAKFPDKVRQADALLIACYFIQHRSSDNVFKCFLAKNTLERSGIILTSLETSLNRLINEQLVLVSKKAGKLTLYKVSAQGRQHLVGLIKLL